MKKILFTSLGIAIIIFTLAFKHSGYEVSKSSAEVDQISGCFLFVNSKPVSPYDFLGTVELTRKDTRKYLESEQFQSVRDLLIKKVKSLFPNADGIIFDFHDGGTDKADAIKFK